MLKPIIFILVFCSAGLFSWELTPVFTKLFWRQYTKKLNKLEKQLEDIFMWEEIKKFSLYFTLSPLVFATLFFLFFRNFLITLVGFVIGFFLPAFVIRILQALRKKKLQTQLLDTIMYLSSSLKGGLSFLQTIEIITEEMPPPISQEFSLVVRQHKMGMGLEESLTRLSRRMQIEELDLLINSILVAREMGGDLIRVLNRLCDTIRDNQKLKQSIATLTLQGKIQGAVMSFLPIVFGMWVFTFNRRHFDIMFSTELGRTLLFICVFLQIMGMLLIRRFSKLRI